MGSGMTLVESSTRLSGDGDFKENARQVYGFIYTRVGNRETAEELTRRVFLEEPHQTASGQDADRRRVGLFGTAQAAVVDYWHRQGHPAITSADEAGRRLFDGSADAGDVARTRERALELLAALPAREREVLTLRLVNGYTADEIGRALDIDVCQVRLLQVQALRHAARELTETRS